MLQLNHERNTFQVADDGGDGAQSSGNSEEDLLESTMQFAFETDMDGTDEPHFAGETNNASFISKASALQQMGCDRKTCCHRGSTHMDYSIPSGTKYWFGQVRLQENPNRGIYWANTFNRGYTGVQTLGDGPATEREILLLCSIWDDKQNGCTHLNTCDPSLNKDGVSADCPGKYNSCGMFGSEGTGVNTKIK